MIRLAIATILLMSLPAAAANFVANSGAELGSTRGWIYVGPTDSTGPTRGRDEWTTTAAASSGERSWIAQGLYSRPMWLAAGDYRLTFDGRHLGSGTQGPLRSGVLNTASLGSVTPAGSQNFTTSWQRFTNSVSISTNGFYHVAFTHFQPHTFLVDRVQLEPGTSASDYEAKSPVELGVDTEMPGGVFLADAAQGRFRVRVHNDGAEFADARVLYEVRDMWSSLIDSGEFRVGVKPGGTTTQFIPFGGLGWRRCTVRLAGVPDSVDEAAASRMPWLESDLPITTRVGTHPQTSTESLSRYYRAGFHEFRSLSPGSAFTRWNTLETAEDTWNWTQADIEAERVVTNGWTVLGVLTPGLDGAWNTWATNGDGSPSLSRWTNYVGTIVARYGANGSNWITKWEVLNEPQNYPSTWYVVSNHVALLTASVKAITDADATAEIIAMAGVSDYTWAWQVWTNLDSGTQAAISAVSAHYYPTVPEPNQADFNHFWKNWRLQFHGTIPVQFTESGVWMAGTDATANTVWPYNYELWASPTYEASRGERMDRLPFHTERWLYTLMRSLGNGMERVHYYDARNMSEQALTSIGSQNTLEDFKDEIKPVGIASAVAGWLTGDALGAGQITNTAAGSGLELYLFSNGTVVAWADDRTRRTLTMTNAAFGVLDIFGNELQTNVATVTISRTPVYLMTEMGTNAMHWNVVNAAVSTADVRPPRVRVAIAPTAEWDGSELGLLRWVAQSPDLYNYPDAAAATNIVSRVRINGGDWTSQSPSNHVWITNLVSAGDNTVEIEAEIDGVGTGTASWQFAPPRVSTPASFTVSGRANAGTVTIE